METNSYFFLLCPPIFIKKDNPFLLCYSKSHYCQFFCFNSKMFMRSFPSPWNHGPLVPSTWHHTSQPQDDACEFIISCTGGKINYFPLYRLRNCLHQYSFSLAYFKGLNFPPQGQCKSYIEFVGIEKPCIEERWEDCYCCNNQPINMCSSLTVTKDFCRISLHWFFIFSTFSFGRPRVIFWESPRNSRFDVGPSTDFWALFKRPKF